MKITQREDGKFALVHHRVVVAVFGTEAEAQAELALLPKDPAGRARVAEAARRSSFRSRSRRTARRQAAA